MKNGDHSVIFFTGYSFAVIEFSFQPHYKIILETTEEKLYLLSRFLFKISMLTLTYLIDYYLTQLHTVLQDTWVSTKVCHQFYKSSHGRSSTTWGSPVADINPASPTTAQFFLSQVIIHNFVYCNPLCAATTICLYYLNLLIHTANGQDIHLSGYLLCHLTHPKIVTKKTILCISCLGLRLINKILQRYIS